MRCLRASRGFLLCVHVVRAHRLSRYHSCPLRQDRGERKSEEMVHCNRYTSAKGRDSCFTDTRRRVRRTICPDVDIAATNHTPHNSTRYHDLSSRRHVPLYNNALNLNFRIVFFFSKVFVH